MAFCPNINSKEWKDLVSAQGEAAAYVLWDKYKGNIPSMFYSPQEQNVQNAKAWVEERFGKDSVNIFESAQAIGTEQIHGYVENGLMYLWSAAEVGTEFHEAYHMVFRTMLSEDQRAGLYAEAEEKFGKPTASEIEAIKKQFPEISDEEARLVALEEKMAEEFRDYVLTEQATEKSLPSKIGKFFRDLWNFIKAIFSNNLGLKQVYSLIESNSMNRTLASRGVFRNAEKFKGTNKAFLTRPGYGDATIELGNNAVLNAFLKHRKDFKDFDVTKALGEGDNKGAIANSFVKQLYSKTDGTAVTVQEAISVLPLEEAFSANPTDENRDALLNALTANGMQLALGDNMTKRTLYKNIYTTWEDTIQPVSGNVVQVGWRTALAQRLADSGIYINSRERDNSDLSDEDNVEVEDEFAADFAALDEAVGKIYGQSSMEVSPAKRLTGRVKELLSLIETGEVDSLGNKTYFDRNDIFKEVLGILAGKQTFSGMVTALEEASKMKPHLNKIVTFLKGLKAQEQAMIFSAFALNDTEFLMLVTKVDGTKTAVEVFNPNRKNIPAVITEKWQRNLVSDVDGETFYFAQTIKDKDGNDIETLTADKGRLLRAAHGINAVDKLLDRKNKPTVARINGEINPIVEQTAQIMWELGLFIGSNTNIGDTVMNLQKIADVQGVEALKEINSKLFWIVTKIGNFSKGTNGNKIGEFHSLNGNSNTDYITNFKKPVVELATFFKDSISSAGISFVNGKGKAIYATNTETHAAQIVNILKAGDEKTKELLEMYFSDEFINTYNDPRFQSVLFKHLNDPKFLEQFAMMDLDASKLGDDEALAYEDFAEADTLVTMINAFINKRTDSDYTHISISVQSDRDKFSLNRVARLSKNPLGKQFMSHKDLIKAQIVQDLVRVNTAKEVVYKASIGEIDPNELSEGYHTAPGNVMSLTKDRQYLGRAFKEEFFQLSAKNESGYIVTDRMIDPNSNKYMHVGAQLSDFIVDYLKGDLDEATKKKVENALDEMSNDMIEYFKSKAKEMKQFLKDAGKLEVLDEKGKVKQPSEIGEAGIIGTDLEGLLYGYLVESTIYRNEFVKLFRGNRALSKDLADFYKRMGHLTTPGTKMVMKGDLGEMGKVAWLNEDYGMMPKFNEIAMRDIKLDITPKQYEEADEAADKIRDGLIASGVNETEAIAIADAYRPGKFDSTDAQSYISLDMHRSIMQGLGKWSEHEEKAYQAYLTTGKFVYQPGFTPDGFKPGQAVPLSAHKGYFEAMFFNKTGRNLEVDSQKNSYHVLIAERTAGFPFLDDLRQRMEATGVYAGMDKVHVVNFQSGKKLSKRGLYKHSGKLERLGEATVNTHDSSKLRFPQFIPAAKENPTNALNRQIKKNMVANVADSTTYYISPGLEDIEIKGEALKDLYHSAIQEKLSRDMENVEAELAIDKLHEAAATNDINEINKAKLEVLKRTRALILSQAQSKEMHSNYEKGLNIIFDEQGTPSFQAPLDLPLYNKKYESVIMSVINNRVFKQKVKGFEAVQVAEFGGAKADGSGSLKFLQISEDGQRVIHAEIMIREDVARKFGIEPGQPLDEIPEELRRVIGYRIPNQDKASVVILKIAKFLPANYEKAVVVPGQLLKLMGSDHDVDKLNLLFPEVSVDKTTGAITKVKANYNELIKSRDVSTLSNAQLNNVILDLMEAVYANKAHFKEVFTPLDDTSLNTVVKEIKNKVPEMAMDLDWSDFKTEIITARRNTLGNKLRGIYANALAARNVLHTGAVSMVDDYAIKINGVSYTSYVKEALADPFNEKSTKYPTDKSISLFLSAAVDASKLPVQYELNDTVFTSRVRTLFAGFFPDYSSRYCSYFLNQPLVRQFTEFFETQHNGNLQEVKQAFNSFISTLEPAVKAKIGINGTYDMSKEELENLSRAGRNMEKQGEMLHNFIKFYEAGQALMKLGKRVTPDSMDGLNRIGSIQSYIDRAEMFDYSEETMKRPIFRETGSPRNVTEQFIGETSKYGLEKGYEDLMKASLQYAGVFFPTRLSPAFDKFKSTMLDLVKMQELPAEMHQLIDYNLMFMMLMRPGSPFAQLMDMAHLYTSSTNNLYTQMQDLKKKYPALNNNPFISNLEQDFDLKAGFYGIKFDNTIKATVNEKEQMTRGLYNLMYRPQFFVSTDKTVDANGQFVNEDTKTAVKEIKSLGIKLAAHSFFINGFRQGASSYADLVPIEFFTTPMKVGSGTISIIDFFKQEANKVLDGGYFSGEDILAYLGMFGKMRAGNQNLLRRTTNNNLTPALTSFLSETSTAAFVVVRNKKGDSAIFVSEGPVRNDKNGTVKTKYNMIKGTYSTKKSTRMYAAGISVRESLGNLKMSPEITSAISTFESDKKPAGFIGGNVFCSI